MKTSRSFAALSGVALYVGLAAVTLAVTRRTGSQAVEEERHLEERRRQREALELHDTVVQGIAAGIWMLDAGCKEGALEALTTTMGVAQHLVSELLGPEEIVPGSLVVLANSSAV
jgi:signal transduction histidine kinase